MTLDETDRQTRETDFRSAREPDDTSPDDENVYFFHWKIIGFYTVLRGSTGFCLVRFYGVLSGSVLRGFNLVRFYGVLLGSVLQNLAEPSRTRRT